ncbi:MAG: hypothetical protein K6C34_00865 [Alphaproteobacteria bacterium]|nr:hypothetical protein [Alphaproteobacteria bacterium]
MSLEKLLNESTERLAVIIGVIGFFMGIVGLMTDAGILLFWAIGFIALSAYILDDEDYE